MKAILAELSHPHSAGMTCLTLPMKTQVHAELWGRGRITPDNIIRQELIFTLVSIGQKSGHGLAGGQAQWLS